jgi:hypothetical protein
LHISHFWFFKLTNNWHYFIPKLAEYRTIMRRKLRKVYNHQNDPAGPNNQQYYAYNDYYGFHQLGYQSAVTRALENYMHLNFLDIYKIA